MAIFNEKRGTWEWSTEEREHRKTALRQVKNWLESARRYGHWTKTYLPQFAAAATRVFQPLVEGLRKLECLDLTNRGPKYKQLSPEEADRLFERVPELLKPWKEFASSAEYAAAVRQKTKEIRQQNKAARAAQAAQWERVQPAMDLMDKGDVMGALEYAAKHGLL
jgi:hypothetical protein